MKQEVWPITTAGDEVRDKGMLSEESTGSVGPPEREGREAELLNRLKYMQADFENYRKRTEKDLKETEETASKSLVVRLLSVLDELDLAVKHSKENTGTAEIQEGIEMVRRNLFAALEASGLEKIDPVGEAFDPSKHEAIETVQGASSGPDTVVEELRPGYLFRGRVIRPSMVKVELAMKETAGGGRPNE